MDAETRTALKVLADTWRVAACRHPGPVPVFPMTVEDATARTLHACADALLAVLVESAAEALDDPSPVDVFTASEAVYAFTAWLTTEPVPTVLGASQDSAVVAERVAAFCARHGLAKPRDGWEHQIVPEAPDGH